MTRRWEIAAVVALMCACGRLPVYDGTDDGGIPGTSPNPTASPVGSPSPVTQTFHWIDPVFYDPSSEDQWRRLDVAPDVPAGATGAIFHVVNTSGGAGFGLRMEGSSDDRTDSFEGNTHTWAMVGLDQNLRAQGYEDELGSQQLWLVGYTMPGVEYFENAVDITPSNQGQWDDIDLSPHTGSDTAIGAIVEITAGTGDFGLRMKGSTDAGLARGRHMWIIVGVDQNEVLEGQVTDQAMSLHLVGYVVEGATFFQNAVDKSIALNGQWTDIDIGADTVNAEIANGAFIAAVGPGTNEVYGLRPGGSTENILEESQLGCGILATDAGQLIQGARSAPTTGFYMVGYSTLAQP